MEEYKFLINLNKQNLKNANDDSYYIIDLKFIDLHFKNLQEQYLNYYANFQKYVYINENYYLDKSKEIHEKTKSKLNFSSFFIKHKSYITSINKNLKHQIFNYLLTEIKDIDKIPNTSNIITLNIINDKKLILNDIIIYINMIYEDLKRIVNKYVQENIDLLKQDIIKNFYPNDCIFLNSDKELNSESDNIKNYIENKLKLSRRKNALSKLKNNNFNINDLKKNINYVSDYKKKLNNNCNTNFNNDYTDNKTNNIDFSNNKKSNINNGYTDTKKNTVLSSNYFNNISINDNNLICEYYYRKNRIRSIDIVIDELDKLTIKQDNKVINNFKEFVTNKIENAFSKDFCLLNKNFDEIIDSNISILTKNKYFNEFKNYKEAIEEYKALLNCINKLNENILINRNFNKKLNKDIDVIDNKAINNNNSELAISNYFRKIIVVLIIIVWYFILCKINKIK